MLLHLGDVVGGALVVPGVTQPPGGGALVEALDRDLVDDQPRAVAQHLGEPAQRPAERHDVVQRDHRDRGVERARRGVDVLERDLEHTIAAARVDRRHVVAGGGQHRGQLALAGADLQHARRRWREGGAREGDGVRRRAQRSRARRRRPRPAPCHAGRASSRRGRHERSGVGRAAGGACSDQAREGAEDGGRERRLSGHVPSVRRAGAALGHARGLEQLAPVRVPAVERGLVELRMKLDAPREAAEAERFRPAALRAFQELRGARRRFDPVLVPVQAVRAGREVAEDRVLGDGS